MKTAHVRAAIRYVRSQFKIMFPKHKPYRHPRYKETIRAVLKGLPK